MANLENITDQEALSVLAQRLGRAIAHPHSSPALTAVHDDYCTAQSLEGREVSVYAQGRDSKDLFYQSRLDPEHERSALTATLDFFRNSSYVSLTVLLGPGKEDPFVEGIFPGFQPTEAYGESKRYVMRKIDA